ncbi:MAG: hypothetical protein U1E27_14390, partial [Kiritimatiellia bacterium]|nr:hypothetical protein [Kiritimatiellia bacterium]
MKSGIRTAGYGLAALLLAILVWLPAMHLFFRPPAASYAITEGVSPMARELARFHLHLWERSDERALETGRMRWSNAEWDFMGRTYFVLALANLGLREPEKKAVYLEVMDRIIEETLRLEKENGIHYFLMDYARESDFR